MSDCIDNGPALPRRPCWCYGAVTVVRPFFTAVLVLLLYMGVAAVILALILAFSPPLTIVFVIGVIVGIVPALNSVARRAFYFKGHGEPVAPSELRRRLLDVNHQDAPVSVQQISPTTFEITWRFREARWWEALSQAGLSSLYVLQLKLDEQRQEVVLVDRMHTVRWGAAPSEVHVGTSRFLGVMTDWKLGAPLDFHESFTPDIRDTATFSPGVIKSPVLNIILASGWNVRMAMW